MSLDKNVVLGAGLCGLAAAYELSQGSSVVVLEKEGALGGLASSVSFGGYKSDLGPHRFHTLNDEVLGLVRSIVPGMRLRDRTSHIYLDKRYIAYPLKASSVFSLSPSKMIRIGLDFLALRLKFGKKDSNFEDWVRNRFGKTMYDIYFGPYTEKVWGIRPSEISKDWAAERITILSLWDVVKKFFPSKLVPRTYVSRFFYPENGIQEIAESFAKKASGRGAGIQKNAVLEKTVVSKKKQTVESVEYSASSKKKRLGVDRLVSTVPFLDLLRTMKPLPPEDVLRAAEKLVFRDLVFCFLKVDREWVRKDNWVYFPQKDLVFNRISEPKVFSKKSCPRGRTSLTVEITCDRGDRYWTMGEGELFERVISDLEKVEMIKGEEAKPGLVKRVENAYPVYDLGYAENLAKVNGFLSGIKNLVSTGRCGSFRYTNMDHSIEMGLKLRRDVELKSQDTG